MAWFEQSPIGEENNELKFDTHHIDRWLCQVRPLPLPAHQAPRCGAPLFDLPDESLLAAPPQLIAHIQRTAAQGGLQVISPRQIPITGLMSRVQGGQRALGDHVVGCVATRGGTWPTIDDYDFDMLLPDEPICMADPNRAVRKKTKAVPLTRATNELSDPVLSCLVTGRAVVDILRRPDVMGGADEMTNVLANAWSVGKEDIDDLDAFTVGIDGPLHRHAIKTDDVYPTCYAPIHVRRSISVGASEATKGLLPPDTGMDWRRMRMHCEAVFAMACSIEGIPLNQYIAVPPPGDPGAASDRRGVLCFRPAPASAWSYEPASFSIFPDLTSAPTRSMSIPRDVLLALTRYTEVIRPVSFALARGSQISARRSTVTNVEGPIGETIMEGYRMIVKSMVVGSARGKTAASTVRNMIFKALESASDFMRLRLARYISIAEEECRVHLRTTEVPDRVIYKLADKFMEVGSTIRLHVVSEAAKRGHTVEDWWSDILAQAPNRFRNFSEGSKGWAIVGLWLTFKSPTDRWRKLRSAMNYTAVREAERRAVGGISLPATKGSPERLLEASRAVVKNIGRAYSGYYMGVYDVAQAIADVLDQDARPTTAKVMREAAYLWNLRARCLRGTNVVPLEHGEETKSPNHLRVRADPIDIAITPAPYRAFEAYKKHLQNTEVLHRVSKRHLMEFKGSRISEAFLGIPTRLASITSSLTTKYLEDPTELGRDMERAWAMLTEDVRMVAAVYGSQERSRSVSPSKKKQKVVEESPINISIPVAIDDGTGDDYFQLIADIDMDQVEFIEEVLSRAGPQVESMFYEERFMSKEHLLQRVVQIATEHPAPLPRTRETVG